MEGDSESYRRSIEDVNIILEKVNIKEHELTRVTQTLYTRKEDCADVTIKLLELDNHLMEVLKNGDSMSFRGKRQDSAVLCTSDQTYEIKQVETSNSWLIVPNLKLGEDTENEGEERTLEKRNIEGIFHTYYEVRKCKPKLENLLTILDPSSYKGKEYESTVEKETLYDWDRLRNEIQASDEELRQALEGNTIVHLDGYYRLISFKAEAQYVTLMLGVFEENSWEVDEVDKEVTYESLTELVIEPVFNCLFHKYAELSDKTKTDGAPLYKYNEEKICKILAKVLLFASPVTEYKVFMESWQIALPEKMSLKKEYLAGLALVKIDNVKMTKDIVSFPEENLPTDINQRLHELFKAKEKWTIEEITPYLLNLTSKTINVNGLLTKYTRCTIVNGVKYYSARYK